MSKSSSHRLYPTSFFFLVVVLSRAVGQEKNGEFKHELPEGVELVDPKSLGLTDDVDLSKFLGNVKVLGGGQVGDTKTQILTVGFEGDENINFNDFTIPGLTDGNNTALPQKDKEIADAAFKKFKEFFQDPKKARQFDENNEVNLQFPPPKGFEHVKNRPQAPQNNVQGQFLQHQRPPHFQIPMIQKPYTTPRTEVRPPFEQTKRPHHHHQQPQNPPKQFSAPFNQAQYQQQQHQVFHSQKPQPQSTNLEFGARIPVSPNPHSRPQQQQFQHHEQNQGQFQFHRQHEQQRQHRLTIQQNHREQQHQQHSFQHPSPHQHNANLSPHSTHSPENYPQPNPPQLVPPPPPQHSPQSQNFVTHPQAPPPSPQSQPDLPTSREKGRVVRNQLLQLNNKIETSHNRPKLAFQTTTNHLPASSHYQTSIQQPPQATATSHVYIQHGSMPKPIEHTSFHPRFQPPTRFAKDFTPLPPQATTFRPRFDITPSMPLIHLSTNENAIKDPVRMMQLRQYQRERAQASSNTHQSQAVLPVQAAPPTTPTTTPISITTSYPENHDHHQFSSSSYYTGSQQFQQQPLNTKYSSSNNNAISENDVFSKPQFSFQKQPQQHQLHLLQQTQTQQYRRPTQIAQTQPPMFYSQQQNSRPPRQGPPPPRFQFHVQNDLGRPPRFHMQPDPKNLLNTIRRKRGYRRLSNLFRMFRSSWGVFVRCETHLW